MALPVFLPNNKCVLKANNRCGSGQVAKGCVLHLLPVLQVFSGGTGSTHVHNGSAGKHHLCPWDTPVFCTAGLRHTEVAMASGKRGNRVL